jgi:hypothetical protein
MGRRLLGSKGSLGGQTRVYRTPDGLEIDEAEDDRIFRKRLFWDEVLMVTLHHARDLPFAVFALIGVGFLALISLGVGAAALAAGIVMSLLTWVPLLAYTVVRLVQGDATVSVYGRRTVARLSFPLRKGRAREVYAEISAAARRRQDAARLAAARRTASPSTPPA